MACVVCFLSPGITVFHCLSKIFSTVVSYILLDFYYFMQKAESGLFHSILTGSDDSVVLFCVFILTRDTSYILFIDHTCVSLVKNLFRALAVFLSLLCLLLLLLLCVCVCVCVFLFALQKVLICLGYQSFVR